MTLKEFKMLVEGIASNQPNVNTIIKSGDIYDLNTLGDIEYGAFCMTQQQHYENDGWRTYNFYLFSVDRLTADGKNKILVQSNAIEVLSNIVRTLKNNEDIEVVGTVNYQTFTQRFASECAGAYCTLSVEVPINDCYEELD